MAYQKTFSIPQKHSNWGEENSFQCLHLLSRYILSTICKALRGKGGDANTGSDFTVARMWDIYGQLRWEDPKFNAVLDNLVRLPFKMKSKKRAGALPSMYRVLCSMSRIANINEIQNRIQWMPKGSIHKAPTLAKVEVRENTSGPSVEGKENREQAEIFCSK